jgi:hypothetical protein
VRPAVGSQAPAEISRALGRAEEATEAMGTIKAWKTAIAVVKQVMDTVDPIAEVRLISSFIHAILFAKLTSAVQLFPHATLAWKLLSKIPEVCLHAPSEDMPSSIYFLACRQTLLLQLRRDDNVRTLLQAILDGFDFVKKADVLRNMDTESTQPKILDEMLECVSECAKFIISYAEDVQFGTSSWPLCGHPL